MFVKLSECRFPHFTESRNLISLQIQVVDSRARAAPVHRGRLCAKKGEKKNVEYFFSVALSALKEGNQILQLGGKILVKCNEMANMLLSTGPKSFYQQDVQFLFSVWYKVGNVFIVPEQLNLNISVVQVSLYLDVLYWIDSLLYAQQ